MDFVGGLSGAGASADKTVVLQLTRQVTQKAQNGPNLAQQLRPMPTPLCAAGIALAVQTLVLAGW